MIEFRSVHCARRSGQVPPLNDIGFTKNVGNFFDYDVIIAGGGPAGSSAAIHLATGGARVLLLEQKKFPRAKLCGEFISPECTPHFERLGVAEKMLAAGPALLERLPDVL